MRSVSLLWLVLCVVVVDVGQIVDVTRAMGNLSPCIHLDWKKGRIVDALLCLVFI